MLEVSDLMWLHSKIKSIADEIVNEAVACCGGEFNSKEFYFENVRIEDLFGKKIRFAAKLPKFFEDEGYSLYLTGMCDSEIDCDVAGYLVVRDMDELDDIEKGLEEDLGCEVEVERYQDYAYVDFKCTKITERDLRRVVDFVGGHVIDQWNYFLNELCECEW